MTARRVLFILSIAVAVFAVHAVTLGPLGDLYSDPEHPGAHPADELWVANYSPTGNYQRIMMMFDLSDYTDETVDSAILNLNRFFGCPAGGITATNFYSITAEWDESTWPGNVHIGHGTTAWATYNFGVNGWHRIDITDLVQEWLDGSLANYGLVIEAQSDSKFSKFYSREASAGVRPYLELFGVTGIDEGRVPTPRDLAIHVSPNPFNSSVNISVRAILESPQQIGIFDINGRNVANIPVGIGLPDHGRGDRAPTAVAVVWRPDESLGSGIYFARVSAGGQTATKRIVFMK